MAHSTWHLYGSIFVYLFMCFLCRNVITLGRIPAVSMEYKVQIPAGKEDCYYQSVQAGASLYFSFQVIRGGDGMAGFAIQHPNGQLVHPHEWKSSAEYTEQTSTGGNYGICIDNQLSRFAEKLVNVYISTVKYEEFDKYIKEIDELHLNMQNFTAVIHKVENNIQGMLHFQSHTRGREARDMALLEDNNKYVQNWSIAQITVIFLTCTFQVYFVRKLFDVKTGITKNHI